MTIDSKVTGEDNAILASADLGAPPERVFRALFTDECERWWGSADTYRIRDWTAEGRVGGRWRLAIHRADGLIVHGNGEFLELEPPGKAVITRRYEFDYPVLGRRDTTVTYQLEEARAGTRLTVRHEGFAGCGQAAAEHAEGWRRLLGWLQAYVGHELRGEAR